MKPRTLVTLLCVTNLAAGVGLGIAGDRFFLVASGKDGRPSHHRRGPPEGGRDFGRFMKQLELDADQQQKVQQIFASRRPLMDAVMHEVGPKMRAIQQETDTQIRSILRPDQIQKLDALRKEWEQRRAEGREGRPPGEGREGRPPGPDGAPVHSWSRGDREPREPREHRGE